MATSGRGRQGGNGSDKSVGRYIHEDIVERGVPETGHTELLPSDERVVRVPMDNGWTRAIEVGHLPETPEQTVLVDMDPVVDPTLFWAGKRNRRDVPVLPLQRNEIVTESRINQIVERVRARMSQGAYQPGLWTEMERALREGEKDRRAEWFTHEEGWKNKLICGDSLQVMESMLEYEGLRGKVQMIYIDPPYGIKYDSNFQQRVDSTRNDGKDQADDVLTIKAFRDTWALGIHSYLSYLQERLYLCRELLADSGSVFVQINDEHLHRVRQLVDEVFGASNHCATIPFAKTSAFTPKLLSSVCDYLVWYSKDKTQVKYHQLFERREDIENPYERYICVETPTGDVIDLSVAQKLGEEPMPPGRLLSLRATDSQGENESSRRGVTWHGRVYYPPKGRHWSVVPEKLQLLADRTDRLFAVGNTLRWKSYRDEFPYRPITNMWNDIQASGFGGAKLYAVQTQSGVVERCIQMTTDPTDLVIDLTCGSGTTAWCAERLGRRWITCDTSRVAINVARRRLLSAFFDSYRTRAGTLSSGLVYKTVNHITLKSLAYDLEPEKVELVDQPEVDRSAIRVTGPFEVMSLGRYSTDDWKGYVNESGTLENYIGVICRLYRKDAAIQSGAGFTHAIAESGQERIALSVGPLSGRVTARQVRDAVSDAAGLGVHEVHVLGWAFEANVGEIASQLEQEGKTTLRLMMIRPDTLAEGLKITQPDTLFSPLTLPDVEVAVTTMAPGQREAQVTLKGVGLFNRKHRTTEYHPAADGYVAAWYLDEDYDGDCFVDCQMFFDFAKAPNLKAALKAEIDPEEYKLQLTSQPFPLPPAGETRRIAVKVVDVYGNEATIVRELA